MAKVSIIIPVYNGEKYLKKCLDSVCNQTLQDIEIIILNDASTDHSLDIIRNYEKFDSRIKVVNMDKNLGPGALRNLGINLANGEYIGFVDNDDFIEPDMYEQLYKKIIENDVDIALCSFFVEKSGLDYVKRLIKNDKNIDGYKIIEPRKNPNFLCDTSVVCWNKLYRHNFIERFCFPENLKFEDYSTIINMLGSTNRIVSLERRFYHYRIRPNSITTADFKKFKPDTLDIFECNHQILDYYTENGLLTIFEDSLNRLFLMHSVSKLFPILFLSMPYAEKKQLVNYFINMLDLELPGWDKSEFYLEQKEKSVRLSPYMKLFEDSSMHTEKDKNKVRQKIIDLCNQQK